MTGGLRAFLGGASIAANYRDHASTSNNILDKFYFHDKQNFIMKSSLNELSKNVWVVWAPIGPLIDFLLSQRNIVDERFLIKIMGDTGQEKTKICISIIPFNSEDISSKRSTYSKGGVLPKISYHLELIKV